MVSKKFAKANNHTVYDRSKPNNWIIYLNANNLYSWTMNKLLPVWGFQCASPELTIDEVLAISDDAEYEYIVEVDIKYPKNLHDTQDDYSLAPEAMAVPES